MKRSLLIFFLTVMLVGTMAACGQKADTGTSGDTAAQTAAAADSAASDSSGDAVSEEVAQGSEEAVAAPGGIYTKGSELSNYLSALTDSEEVFEENINTLNETASMDAQLDRVIMNLSLLTLPQYDILSTEDLDKEEGTLMLAGFKGVRERSGDEIKFSCNHTYEEDQMNNKKGDIYSEQGVLNTKSNTLTYEMKKERSGNVIDRTVIEASILDDGTYLIQYLTVSVSSREGDPANTTAVFKRYNQKEYSAITADFDPKFDFTFNSILGKGDVQTDTMASGYTITGKFTVKDGTATFSK